VGSTKDLKPASLIFVSRILCSLEKSRLAALFSDCGVVSGGKKRGFYRLRFRVATPERSRRAVASAEAHLGAYVGGA
jgi:hypothetical protein